MGTATIHQSYSGDEAPAAVDLLSLTRADTGAAVPFGAAAFADDGGGAFSHSFATPADGLSYLYTFRLTWSGGGTQDLAATFADPAGSYAGRYTSQAAVRTWLGTINADVIADLDGDGAPDAGAYAQSIAWGEDELDLNAAGGPAAVPFVFGGGTAGQQGVAQRTVQRWATVLSGWQLAFKRPAAQGNLLTTPANAQTMATLDGQKRAVLDEIKRWRNGTLLLPGLTATAAVERPGQFVSVPASFGPRTLFPGRHGGAWW